MKLDIFLQKASNIQLENKLLKIIVIVIGLTVLFNTYQIQKISSKMKVILIPVGLNTQVEVSENNASDAYLKHISRYVMGLLLNYTPSTIRPQYGELLNLVSPETYTDYKENLDKIIANVESLMVSSFFVVNKIEKQGNVLTVQGKRTLFSQNDKVIENKAEVYNIHYTIKDGKFEILKIQEVKT